MTPAEEAKNKIDEARFECISELTRVLCNLTERDIKVTLTFNDFGVGIALLTLWSLKKIDVNFVDVIARIFWGKYLSRTASYSPQAFQLVELIREEIEQRGPLYLEWIKTRNFYMSFDYVTYLSGTTSNTPRGEPCWHLEEHHKYMQCRAEHIVYDNSESTNACSNEQYLAEYEGIVIKLLPEAAKWDFTQWGDDQNIIDGFKQKYDVDFSASPYDYDYMIRYLREPSKAVMYSEKSVAYCWEVMSIKAMSFDLAKILFPSLTEQKIIAIFQTAYAKVEENERKHPGNTEHSYSYRIGNDAHRITTDFSWEYLKASWLCRQMTMWIANKTITDNDLRVKVFNLNNCIQ